MDDMRSGLESLARKLYGSTFDGGHMECLSGSRYYGKDVTDVCLKVVTSACYD